MGPLNHRLVVGSAGEELLHQVPTHAQLRFRGTGQPGQLHGQHRRGVLQGNQLELADPVIGVEESEGPDHVGPRGGEADNPIAMAAHPTLGGQFPQHALPDGSLRLGAGLRRLGRGARPKVAVAILDGDREPGQLVQGLGQRLRSPAGAGHLVDTGVDLHHPVDVGQAAPEGFVDGGQLGGGRPASGDRLGVGERGAGLLGEELQEKLLLGARFPAGEDDQEPATLLNAPQQEGEGPDRRGDGQVAATRAEGRQLAFQRRAQPPVVLQSPGPQHPAAGVPGVDPGRLAVGDEGRDRRGGEMEDLFVGAFAHEHRQRQDAVETGGVLPGDGARCGRHRDVRDQPPLRAPEHDGYRSVAARRAQPVMPRASKRRRAASRPGAIEVGPPGRIRRVAISVSSWSTRARRVAACWVWSTPRAFSHH